MTVDYTYKICIFGDGGVGKTSLTERYLMGFYSYDTKRTIGASFYQKNLMYKGLLVSLSIWDFAGEEEFRSLFPNYIKGSSGAIFMYDLTRYSSLKNVKAWLDKMKEAIPDSKIPLVMVGGKADLVEKRAVNTEIAENILQEYGFKHYLECSAKTGENVELVFQKLTEEILLDNDVDFLGNL